MKKVVLLAVMCLSLVTYGQENQSNNAMRNTWRLSLNVMNGVDAQASSIPGIAPTMPVSISKLTSIGGTLEWEYQIKRWLSMGLYGTLKNEGAYPTMGALLEKGGTTMSFGMASRIHILPLANIESRQFDLYLTGKMGAWSTGGLYTLHHEYGLGAGIGWMPLKHWGLFIEASLGKFEASYEEHPVLSNNKIDVGLIFRH